MEASWVFDESAVLTGPEAVEASRRTFRFDAANEPPINITIFDVIVDETRKRFGGADIRVDALVVTPAPADDQLYQADTFTFSEIKDGETLPIDPASGLGIYTGWPQYFLSMAVIVSRGGQDQKSLPELLADSADQLGDLLGNVAQLTAAAPHAGAITGAAAAAVKLGGAVLHLLDGITGKSIGLYRATWYEHRHNFGLGHHPDDGGLYAQQDFRFRYEIFQDQPSG